MVKQIYKVQASIILSNYSHSQLSEVFARTHNVTSLQTFILITLTFY